MKDKFIRILSPMTLAVVILLDLAVIGYGVFAVYRLTQVRTAMTVIFAIIEIAAIVIAVLTTKETVKNGLLLRATDFEFTGMDKDNVYAYDQIKDITGYKDEAPSLVKNFIDRHAVLTLTLTDDTTVLLDLGLCQKRTLETVQKALCERCGVDYQPPTIKTKLEFKSLRKRGETEKAEKQPDTAEAPTTTDQQDDTVK